MILLLFAYVVQLCVSQEKITICDNIYDFGLASSITLYSQAFLSNFNVTIITSGNSLHFLNSGNTKAFPSISLENNTDCPYLYAEGDFIIVGCYHTDGTAYLLRFTCTATSCKQFGLAAEFTVQLSKITKIAQAASTLIFLQQENILLFKLVFSTNNWEIQGHPQVLDSEFFYRTQLNLTDFDIHFMDFPEDQQYKILLLDQYQDILWVDLVLRNSYLFPYFWGQLPVKTLFYIKNATSLQSIEIMQSKMDKERNITTLLAFVTTDLENAYQFRTEFTLYSNKTMFSIVDTFWRYQNWTFIDYVTNLDAFVAIPFQYDTENKIRISLYRGNTFNEYQLGYFSISKIIKSRLYQHNQDVMIGATARDYVNCQYSENFFMYFSYRNDKLYFNYLDMDYDQHRVITQCELIGY